MSHYESWAELISLNLDLYTFYKAVPLLHHVSNDIRMILRSRSFPSCPLLILAGGGAFVWLILFGD